MVEKILLIGSAGSVGHDMMYLIVAMNSDISVIGTDVNEAKGRGEIEVCFHVAHYLGNYPNLSFRKMDLFDVKGTAEILEELKPSVICNLASLGSWWITRQLPIEIYKKIQPLGPWIPNHLTLVYKLMQAVKKSGIETKVVNGAYPDVTNVVLSRIGMGPTCGGGNMDAACGRIKRLVAREMGVPYRSVSVYGVGHHGASYTARLDAPYWVKILVDGEDVTGKFPNEKITNLYQRESWAATPQFKGQLVDQMTTAASFLKHVRAIYYDTREVQPCVAGPNGLPGAYPARLSAEGAEVVLPGISLDEAVKINEAGARIDGIEMVKKDGTVVFVEENVRLMRDTLGYECKELKVTECEERARELNIKLQKLYEKYNIG